MVGARSPVRPAHSRIVLPMNEPNDPIRSDPIRVVVLFGATAPPEELWRAKPLRGSVDTAAAVTSLLLGDCNMRTHWQLSMAFNLTLS